MTPRGNDAHALIPLDDLDRLEGLSARHAALLRRIDAEAEATAHYDRPSRQLQDLQAEAARIRREAAEVLRRMLEGVEGR